MVTWGSGRGSSGGDDGSGAAVGPAAVAMPGPARTSQRPGAQFARALRRDRKGLAGAIMLLFFLVLAIFPGEIAPYSPSYIGFPRALPPSAAHWLGTTSQGQDIYSQLIWGTRQSLIIALAAGGLATLISVLIGVSAAYLGGIRDGILSLITDVLLVIPIFPLIIVIAAYLRGAGLADMIIVLGALGWSYGARQLRVQALSLRNRDFLTAAAVRGERSSYIIAAEIMPTLTSLIVATFLGSAVFAVLTAAGLQFVGLGNPDSQSWGTMLYWAQNNEALSAGMPLWALMPGVCIALLGGAFAFLNYAFDEISNPALRPVRRLRRKPAVAAPAAGRAGAGGPGVDAPPPSGPERKRASGAGVAPRPPADAAFTAPVSAGLPVPARAGLPVPAGANGDRGSGRLLEVRQLSVAYATEAEPVVAVDNVDLSVDRGEFLAVVGESGCGKSTLMLAIAQLLAKPAGITGGSVNFRGHEMAEMSDRQLRHVRWQEYSVVMQSAMNALNPVMTIGQQLRDACKAHAAMSREQIRDRSREILRLVSIDPVHLGSYSYQLSGGMRQRAMIAMALLFTPDLVIMDEPTSALDVVAQRSLMRQIKELQDRLGFATIFVTHDISLVGQFSDRTLVMYAGQVAELGPTPALLQTPRHPYARALLEAFPSVRGPKIALTGIAGSPPNVASPPPACRFQPRCADAMPECSAVEPPLYALEDSVVRCLLYTDAPAGTGSLAGRSARVTAEPVPAAEAAGPPAGSEPSDPALRAPVLGEAPLLEVADVSRQFRLSGFRPRRMLHAVDDVSFAIGRREIVALVGESGSGKSTIARLLTLIYQPDSGEIRFEGKPVSALSGRRDRLAYRGHVPMVFQDPYSSINPAYRVSHGIMRAIELHRPDISPAGRGAEALRVMEAVGLRPAEVMLSKYPYELSGGQRQRIGFAQALALRPKLIVADEPVSMLDVSIRVGVLNLMADLRAREDVSLLYITHDLASARYVADRIIVMYAGHVVEVGPAEQVLAAPRHPYTQLLLSAVPDPRAPEDTSGTSDAAEPPRVVNPEPGCRFAPRCPVAIDECRHITPELGEVASAQFAACHVALLEAGSRSSA